jgi:hypothetical protein
MFRGTECPTHLHTPAQLENMIEIATTRPWLTMREQHDALIIVRKTMECGLMVLNAKCQLETG